MGKRKSKKEKVEPALVDGGGDDLGEDNFVAGTGNGDDEGDAAIPAAAVDCLVDDEDDSDGDHDSHEGSLVDEDDDNNNGQAADTAARKRKDGKKFEGLKAKRRRLNEEYSSLIETMPLQPLEVQVKFLTALVRQLHGDTATPDELDGMLARASAIDVEPSAKLHAPGNLALLLKRIKGWNAMLGAEGLNPRRPRILFLCSSKARCAAVVSELQPLVGNGCVVGKLFGRRDPEGQSTFLAKAPVPVCVGTPPRVRSLCAAGSVELDDVKLLFVDMYRDGKGLTVLDLHDTRKEAVEVLAKWKGANARIMLL